jgi:cytochrome c
MRLTPLLALAAASTFFYEQPAFAQTQATLPALLGKNACTACHAVDRKAVGPALKDVANKYRGDKDAAAKLSAKIKSGGSGAWGSIPMPPQPVKDDDLRLIVKQILELK